MKTRIVNFGLSHELKFTCEDFDEDMAWLDTQAWFNGRYLFFIAGSDIDAFIEAFKKLHSDFAI